MKQSSAALLTLHRALMRDPPANVVRSLIKAFPDAIYHRDGITGMLPIHICAKFSKKSALGLAILIRAFPNSINIPDSDGRLALHWASEFDAHESVVDMLIDKNPQTLYVMDKDGNTPLDFLKTREGFDIKQFIPPTDAENDLYTIEKVEVHPSLQASVEQKLILKRLTDKIPGYSFHENVKIGSSHSRMSSFSTVESWFNDNEDSTSISLIDDAISRRDEELGEVRLAKNQKEKKVDKQEHRQLRQYWRDISLGLHYGLLSTFVLISGVIGSGYSAREAFMLGLAGSLSSTVVLAVGEYMATTSQNQIDQVEVELEQIHIKEYHIDEMNELSEIFKCMGIYDEGLCSLLSEYYNHNDFSLLKAMATVEFGLLDHTKRSPLYSAFFTSSTYFTGSLMSLLPLAFTSKRDDGIIFSTILTFLGLCLSSYICFPITKKKDLIGIILRSTVIAGFGGAAAFGVGELVRFVFTQ